MAPVDLESEDHLGVFTGLRFDVEAKGRGAPPLHVEVAGPTLFRVRQVHRTVLMARVRAGLSGLWWARPDAPAASLAVLPPLRGSEARERRGDLRSWAWRFHELLLASPATCLHQGVWHIEVAGGDEPSFGGHPRMRRLETCLDTPSGFSPWGLNGSGDVLALRPPSAPDSGRVKAFRKLCREKALPPLLVHFVSGMDSYLLLDGHDRLRAALLEGARPDVLVLTSVRKQEWPDDPEKRAAVVRSLEEKNRHPLTGAQLDRVNRALIAAHRPPHWVVPKTRVWPVAGGREAFRSEAAAVVGAPLELSEP